VGIAVHQRKGALDFLTQQHVLSRSADVHVAVYSRGGQELNCADFPAHCKHSKAQIVASLQATGWISMFSSALLL
jgi:hypothetical protein